VTDDLIARLRIVPLHSGFGRTCHEAADALEAQARRIAELEERPEIWDNYRIRANDRIAELKEALEPFAEITPVHRSVDADYYKIKTRDLRAARAAYMGEKE